MVTSNISNESTPRTECSNAIASIGEGCTVSEIDTIPMENGLDSLNTMNIHRPRVDSESSGNYGYEYAEEDDATEPEEINSQIYSPPYKCLSNQQGQIHQLQQLQQQQLHLLQQQQQQKLQLLQKEHERLQHQQQAHNPPCYYQNDPKSMEAHNVPSKDFSAPIKVRKVKSEMKYIDTPTAKDGREKKKESKSDHEFANDSDVSDHNFPNIVCDILWNYFINNSASSKISSALHP